MCTVLHFKFQLSLLLKIWTLKSSTVVCNETEKLFEVINI